MLSDCQVESIFAKYDKDNDKKLSSREFKNMIEAKKVRSMKKRKMPEIKVTPAEYPWSLYNTSRSNDYQSIKANRDIGNDIEPWPCTPSKQ